MANIQTVKEAYYNPESGAAFGGVDKLYKTVKQNIPGLTRKHVKEWLQSQETYTLHKPVQKRFTRNVYHVTNIDELYQADLVDLRSLRKHNDNLSYILTVIDVFSKKAFVRPLKTKTSGEVADAFKDIFERERKVPGNIQTDKGGEFLGHQVQKLFRKHDINFYVAKNPDIKCSVIERFNRTLKSKMFKYFTFKNTYRYVDMLQNLVHGYNNSTHSTIKMKPNDVNAKNILEVYNNMYKKPKLDKSAEFLEGDSVRISKFKHNLEKGYTGNWSDEIFKIKSIIRRVPCVYTINDLKGEPVDGVF